MIPIKRYLKMTIIQKLHYDMENYYNNFGKLRSHPIFRNITLDKVIHSMLMDDIAEKLSKEKNEQIDRRWWFR